MLKYYVELFPNFYFEKKVSYNVHSLLHLTECVEEIGFINCFSAYEFENYMQHLKRLVKKPSQILQQINNKITFDTLIKEHKPMGIKQNRNGSISSFSTLNYYFSLRSPDNFCFIQPGFGVRITKIFKENSRICILGKRLENCVSLFKEPCDSFSNLSIFIADTENEKEEVFDINFIQFKLMRLPLETSFVFIPVLHTIAN